jgi:uncharacterized protein (DUF427 family)
MNKPIKIPGPDHPITITPTKGRVTATVNGKRIADTREALTLKEAAYPPVQYIPRKDVDMTQLQRTAHQTYCPYKGECAYYSIPAGGERSVNAVWSYEAPHVRIGNPGIPGVLPGPGRRHRQQRLNSRNTTQQIGDSRSNLAAGAGADDPRPASTSENASTPDLFRYAERQRALAAGSSKPHEKASLWIYRIASP